MKEFYDYKGKGPGQVRFLPPAPEWQPIIQSIGRLTRIPSDVVILDYVDLLHKSGSGNRQCLMDSVFNRMKTYNRTASRRKKIIKIYAPNKSESDSIKIKENWDVQ